MNRLMDDLAGFTAWAAVMVGAIALITLMSRTPLSKVFGWISIGCAVISIIAVMVNGWALPGLNVFVALCALSVPGILAIVANQAPRRTNPGHCTECGYNLTGNVSGICSECGEPVPAP